MWSVRRWLVPGNGVDPGRQIFEKVFLGLVGQGVKEVGKPVYSGKVTPGGPFGIKFKFHNTG